MSLVTREQLRVYGELADYSHDEIEAMIAKAFRDDHPAIKTYAEVYARVLAEMRADHKRRSVEQFRLSIGGGAK